MSNRLAIFDCDGTLVDGHASVVSAIERCFAAAGIAAPDPLASRRIIGLSLTDAMQALLPHEDEDLHTGLAEAYRREFRQMRVEGMVSEPLYEGIAATLEALETDGWLLAVATGKSDRGLGICLDHHGIRRRFISLQTADRHPSKPHPSMIEEAMADAGASPETTIMIGDTTFDMIMAKAGGVGAIGVAWGYHPPEELTRAGADFIADTPADISSIARSL